MKKLLCLLFLVSLILVGCAGADKDDLAEFRNQTSAQLFTAGEKALASGNYETSIKNFEALDAIYPFGPNSRQGQLDLIYAYYQSGDNASALAAAERYIRLNAHDRDVDYAYYMKGLVLYDQGPTWLQKQVGTDMASRDLTDKKRSFSAFGMLVRLFPRSQYRDDAILHMRYIRNLMARRQVEEAEFYMKRKAYVAAVSRSNEVLAHYSETPSVIPALDIMVRGYRKLGMHDMASKTLKVFQASYPKAPQLDSLVKA